MPYFQRDGQIRTIFNGTGVLSASAKYSDGFSIERGEFFGVWLSATPGSAVSAGAITLWYELAPSDTSSLYVCAGSVARGISALSGTGNGQNGTASAYSISPLPMSWIRFGVSATSGGNLATNQFSAHARLFMK